MAKLRIAEVFGCKTTNHSAEATDIRQRKWCPFREVPAPRDEFEHQLQSALERVL